MLCNRCCRVSNEIAQGNKYIRCQKSEKSKSIIEYMHHVGKAVFSPFPVIERYADQGTHLIDDMQRALLIQKAFLPGSGCFRRRAKALAPPEDKDKKYPMPPPLVIDAAISAFP
jgi:hypothetical protein